LLHLLDHLDASVDELNQAVEEAGQHREDVRLLMTHPGVGRIVALAFALIVGPVDRFPSSKKLVSYLGLNPSEHSSGGRQRLGVISKQGNRLMRSLLVEAAQTATPGGAELATLRSTTEVPAYRGKRQSGDCPQAGRETVLEVA
jgi:transposase